MTKEYDIWADSWIKLLIKTRLNEFWVETSSDDLGTNVVISALLRKYKPRVMSHTGIIILFPSSLPAWGEKKKGGPLDIQKHYAENQGSYFSLDEDDEFNSVLLVTKIYQNGWLLTIIKAVHSIK